MFFFVSVLICHAVSVFAQGERQKFGFVFSGTCLTRALFGFTAVQDINNTSEKTDKSGTNRQKCFLKKMEHIFHYEVQ